MKAIRMKTILKLKIGSILVAVVCGTVTSNAALISLGRTNYFQNFDTLPLSGKSQTLPLGWAMQYPTDKAGGTTIFADDGSSSAGRIYSYGSSGSSDRALGSLRDYTLNGSMSPMFGANFQNNSGGTLNRLNISYTGEEWRLGAAGRGADRLQFQYSLNAGSLTSGTWINVPALDFLTPNLTGVGAHNGNLAANQSQLSSSISFLNIPAGATFWVRWVDAALPHGGPEDGLAVDNFNISAVPETQTMAAGFGMALLLAVVVFRRGAARGAKALALP
jgi:hypothetical protein